MNKKSLVKIINTELTILADIVSEFSKEGEVHPFEVEMALSKIKDIYGQLLLLKENDSPISIQVQNQLTPQIGNREADLLELPVKNTVIAPEIETRLDPAEPIIKIQEIEVPEKPIQKEELTKEMAVLETMQQDIPIDETDHPNLQKPETGMKFIPQKQEEVTPVETSEITFESAIEEPIPTNEASIEIPIPNPEELAEAFPNAPLVQPIQTEPKPTLSETTNKTKSGIIADRFQNLSPSLNDMLSGIKKKKDLASSIKNRPIRNLKSAIKLNDRIWFTNELFNKNKVIFEKTIDTVNQSADLDEALAYLFSNFKWDQNQKSTISFLELVFRRFAN